MADRRTVVLVFPTSARSGPWSCASLARAGFRVVGADDESGRLVGRSLHCLRPVPCPSPLEDPDACVERLRDLCADRRVDAVLPLDEAATQLLALKRDLFGGVALCAPTEEQFEAVCDKVALARTAARAGVDSPRHVVVGADGVEGEWPPLPCIVKPASTATLARGRIVYRTAAVARDVEERTRLVAQMLESTGSALVEERVTGRAWRVHFARGRVGFRSRTIETLRSYPPSAGFSTVQVVTAPCPGLLEAAEALLAAIAYRGIGSVQLFEVGGRLLVHDVNLRMPATAAIAISSGLDLPRLAVAAALDGTPAVPERPVRQTGYVWLEGELRTACVVPAERFSVAGRVLHAALAPGWVLDPADPLALAGSLAAAARFRFRRPETPQARAAA